MPLLEIDDYILDTLMRRLVGHDRQPSAYLVYLLLWRLSHGKGRPRVQIALTDIAEEIGISKRSVQDALSWLHKQKLLSIERETITAIPRYTVLRPWRR
jgi:DNA-binding GntR family transcriptional regulator